MKVEICKWGEDVYGIQVDAGNEEEDAILKRFHEGGAKTNVRGSGYVQFTFADMLEKPKEVRKTRQRLEAVAQLVCNRPEEAVKTLELFRVDIREESREQLIAELSSTLGRFAETALGSVIKGFLQGLVYFPIEPIMGRAMRMSPDDRPARVV